MKKHVVVLALIFLFVTSTFAQNVHSITYLAVPMADTQEFLQLHKKFSDLSAGEDRTLLHTWLFKHARGGDYSMMVVDVYPSQEALYMDKPQAIMKKKYCGNEAV